MLSDKEIKDFWDKYDEENTPAAGNSCKKCGGKVVQQVMGMFHGRFEYANPACEKCGTLYLHAQNAPKVGANEFLEFMRRPMTF